jgi:hypothetical protein
MGETNDNFDNQVIYLKPKDPLTALPPELVQLIFSRLSYKQHVQMLQVSKSWNDVLHNISPLIDTLSLHCARKIEPNELEAALKRWKIPKVLLCVWLTEPASEILSLKFKSWQILETLEYLDVVPHLSLDFECPLPKNNLKYISFHGHNSVPVGWICNALLRTCSSLEAAYFSKVVGDPSHLIMASRSLRKLQIYFDGQILPAVSDP